MTKNKNQNLQNIKKRLRTDLKYSAISTMLIRLLKKHKLYKSACQTAKIARIKSQKNFSIIVFRLSYLYRELLKQSDYTPKNAVQQIFKYLKNNLECVLKRKFMKQKQNNSDLLYDATLGLNWKDIQILEKVLRSGLKDYDFAQFTLEALYERNKNGKFCAQQINSIRKLTNIFFQSTSPQVEQIQEIEQDVVMDQETNLINQKPNQNLSQQQKRLQSQKQRIQKLIRLDNQQTVAVNGMMDDEDSLNFEKPIKLHEVFQFQQNGWNNIWQF